MFLVAEYYLLAFISLTCQAKYMAHASLAHHEASTPKVSDSLALMSFKSHIRSDPSGALASWGNLTIPMCKWRGVGCDLRGSRRGRVVALDLTKLNLLGTITPAVGNLTYLRRLHLSQNRFYGILPPQLGNLQELEALHLSSNAIHGQIPPSLSNCSNLVEMFLNSNKLYGGIPSELSSLHNLQLLILAQNRLTGRIPSGIGSLMNLKNLNLLDNNLTGEIPTEIGKLAKLSKLRLGSNQFSGTIPDSLGNLSSLTFLSIFTTNLGGSIPPLQGLSSLNVLELGDNKLEGTIPSWFGNLSSLVHADLQKNHLVGQIPESLGNLKQLTVISLSNNNLSGSLPHALGNLYSLAKLYIDNNELEGPLTPMMLNNISSLELLDIEYNNLNGVLPSNIGDKLPKLNTFLVSDNQFQGPLPSSLCNASMLQIIETIENFLSGTIPPCLGSHQGNLYAVSIGRNQLEATNDADWGFISSLTNCSKLIVLDVSDNQLQGVLPNSIGNLSTGLQFLNIAYNNITGTITEGMGNLINLVALYMPHNSLIGPIPASLGNLNKLAQLYLSNNAFAGPIPVSFGNLTKLTTLILGTNMISGAIPSSLGNCNIESLDISHNNLSGTTPKELFFISTLSNFMRLAHNFLSGSLPSEVGNLKNLNELDLSNNMFSSDIPPSIGECESLEYLNLSGNILQGTIPQPVGNLRGLMSLDLSYNNLSGSIPEILGSLTGLSSLNLSFNKFQGAVPKTGVFLNATAVLITGNSRLCGGIPQLKLSPCSSQTTKKSSARILARVVPICSALLFATLAFAVSMLYKKVWRTKENVQMRAISEQFTRVSYAELANATDGFSSDNLIGSGSFGSVYKGGMGGDGQQVTVAIKVLNLTRRGAYRSFNAECETLKGARHRNLVKILTVCSSIDSQGCDFKAIVYEFLPNGNLDQWLHHYIMVDGEQSALDLISRLGIAIDVASSLDYLHQHKPAPIIHCDLKPSNVLLDNDMVAHVGDFGLARFLHQDTGISSGWASMRGSIGYAAPEYGLGNEVSTHGDVYSYGILLLEMFTGRRPTDSEFGASIGLREYVQRALPNRVDFIADQQLLTETEDVEASTSNFSSNSDLKITCIASVLQVGICCSEKAPTDRVPISVALKDLQAIKDKFLKHVSSEGASLSNH